MRTHKGFAMLPSALMCVMALCATAHSQEPSSSPARTEGITVIHAGSLLAEPGQGVWREQTSVITNGTITSVEPGYRAAAEVSSQARLIDMKDGFVMPGLMDLHKHIAIPLNVPPEFLATEGKLALLTAGISPSCEKSYWSCAAGW